MDDLLDHFIVEARELIQQATDDLLALERNSDAASHIDGAFRAVHTLKGSVGLFDFAPMGLALHAAEDLLGGMRAGRAAKHGAAIDELIGCINQTERWVDAIERTGHLPAEAAEEGYRLARALRLQLDEEAIRREAPDSEADLGWIEEAFGPRLASAALRAEATPLVALRYIPRADCFFAGDDPLALLQSVPDLRAVRISNRNPWPPAAEMDPFSCNLVIEALSGTVLDAVKAVFRFVPDQVTIHEIAPGAAISGHAPASHDATRDTVSATSGSGTRMLRIDAARIDRMADLVGEMVVAKNALAHLVGQVGDGSGRKDLLQGLHASQATIDRLVAEMHRAVMDIRLMPMQDIFRRFPRAVRDISGQLGKTVDFSIEGEDVEADKSVVEGLFEPLLHVLRNAVDHGAESENQRVAAGKPGRTRIVLRARRVGDRVLIEVDDDGRGIDPSVIRRVARERNVAPAEELDRMSDAEAVDLIFAPGFSTAAEVTDVSGRGVGMDAVRATIERLGGHASVQSTRGAGTTIRLALPVSVAMTRIMAVRVSGELYGLPLDHIVETVLLPASRVLPVRDAEAFVLRDRTLPLIRLAGLLGLPPGPEAASGMKIVVMAVGDELVGIAVDGFAERIDALMRPLSGILSGMSGVMGTTLLGDGSVLMILDIPELLG
ncbi:chemotaxis protein CheA [Microvirga pakistanensis]|uniref:chemotaxis protein CheA n=1 Tax=Microvirga pakistanensis TaxID=1682650 RepID=UPI00141BDDED|nr:chemotaxis protein CheA [Microvirga pakistanensis]